MLRLVATDLDGTLLGPDGLVSDRSIAAVEQARSSGFHVIPVTGRRPQTTWKVAETAGLGPLGVCANGAMLIDLDGSRRVLEIEALAADITHAAIDMVRSAVPGMRLAALSLDRLVYEPGYFDDAELVAEGSADEVPDVGAVLSEGCVKLMARAPGWSAGALLDVLAERTGEVMHVTSSGPDSVDIGAPGVSKAYALQRVCDRLGVKVTEVVAVGDHYNDLSVLGWAGHAMAPSNAIDEVLAAVDRVLPANAEDGVAQLLEELVAGGR